MLQQTTTPAKKRSQVGLFCDQRCACCFASSVVFGIVFAIVGIAGFIILPKFITAQVRSQIVCTDKSTLNYAIWQDHGGMVEVYMNVTMFNITNALEVASGKANATYEAIGPYCFREYNWKTDIEFSDDDNVVEFHYHNPYVFEPSCSDENVRADDTIITWNTAYFTLLNLAAGMNRTNMNSKSPSIVQEIIVEMIENAAHAEAATPGGVPYGPLITRTALQLLQGYEDPLLKQASYVTFGQFPSTVALMPSDKPYYAGGKTKQYTGKKNISQIQSYFAWKGYDRVMNTQNPSGPVPVWGTDGANIIQGTDAWTFEPGRATHDANGKANRFWIFVDSLFRSATLAYARDEDFRGINTHAYILDPELLVPGSPLGDGYFMPLMGGMLNLTSPQNGAPVFVSKPFWLGANPYYRHLLGANDGGLRAPNPSWEVGGDETVILVEPITGTGLVGKKRLQTNLRVCLSETADDEWIYAACRHVNATRRLVDSHIGAYMPINIQEEYTFSRVTQTDLLKTSLFGLVHKAHIAMYCALFGGLAIFFVGGFLTFVTFRRVRKQLAVESDDLEPLLHNSISELHRPGGRSPLV